MQTIQGEESMPYTEKVFRPVVQLLERLREVIIPF